ncbi:hypothetical protein [Pseudomonas sp. TUM22785]|uniref:hypothetical protein n=1 Tax=Pseudomonas sp. TUM22785 TaxID=3019098 RepID=UPI00230601A7|nr:hypothetical protein [Pseudomonas sp. TUM22785]WCD79187.1 hypothetical protein PI990_24820 [Pseudomonas sp. TUM22785]
MTALQRKERPIIFSGPMVRAILEGRKTVTRRVVKPAPVAIDAPPPAIAGGHWEWKGKRLAGQRDEFLAQCPYGQPGDRLWVRETYGDADCRLTYRADLDDGAHCKVKKWIPAIHMFRRDSRILLEITDVRVERLQAISTEQAMAEGVRRYERHAELGDYFYVDDTTTYSANPLHSFELLWKGINGADSWDANPWVWVVEFRRIQP